MNSAYGLLVALALGAGGAMLNWSYLLQRSRDVEKVYFVGVRDDVLIPAGETFRQEDLTAVGIPKNAVGNLMNYAVQWEDLSTVVGMPVIRKYQGGELVLLQDQRTPPPAPRLLNEDERAIGVPIDTRTFVPSLHKQGDFVSFLVPKSPDIRLSEDGTPPSTDPEGHTEIIGPFEIHTVGSRAASSNVSRAANEAQAQENVLRIVVKTEGGQLEPKARKLTDLLLTTTFRNVMVISHPDPKPMIGRTP